MPNKPGRPLTDLERRHLQMLHERRERTREASRVWAERFEDFLLECQDTGASLRGLAKVLGKSPSTVQTWTENARARRGSA